MRYEPPAFAPHALEEGHGPGRCGEAPSRSYWSLNGVGRAYEGGK